jgi:hypothetical protein
MARGIFKYIPKYCATASKTRHKELLEGSNNLEQKLNLFLFAPFNNVSD